MRIAMGSDHAGFPLKEDLKAFLSEQGHEVVDCGTDSTEPVDYPAFCAAAATLVAQLSREHNDANVLSMGARVIAPAYAREITRVWLATEFQGGRHIPRLEQIAEIERGELPR